MKAAEARELIESKVYSLEKVYKKIRKNAEKGLHWVSIDPTKLSDEVIQQLRRDGYLVYQSTHRLSDGSVQVSWGEPKKISNKKVRYESR